MDETYNREQPKSPADVQSRKLSKFVSPEARLAPSFLELADFSKVIRHSILHPIEALDTYLPHLNPIKMLGGKTFNPEIDIPDLSGKIVLVTGGTSQSLLPSP